MGKGRQVGSRRLHAFVHTTQFSEFVQFSRAILLWGESTIHGYCGPIAKTRHVKRAEAEDDIPLNGRRSDAGTAHQAMILCAIFQLRIAVGICQARPTLPDLHCVNKPDLSDE